MSNKIKIKYANLDRFKDGFNSDWGFKIDALLLVKRFLPEMLLAVSDNLFFEKKILLENDLDHRTRSDQRLTNA